MTRVVLDTNVLVSALFWEGNERDILRRCGSGELRSVTSAPILDELERVLGRKFGVPEERARDYVREIVLLSELVFPKGGLDVIGRDPRTTSSSRPPCWAGRTRSSRGTTTS